MEYVELKQIKTSLKSLTARKNTEVFLVKWPLGWVMVFRKREKDKMEEMSYFLRLRHEPKPRVFKNIDIAAAICEELGFTFMTLVIAPQKEDFGEAPTA